MKREFSMDMYRVCLMFGICLLHSITHAVYTTAWVANMLSWCVPGFMFISGWFGIKFTIGKVLKLYGISLYCAVIYVAFDIAVSGGWTVNCIIRAYNITKGQWFLNAYVIVMCLAPMVNIAVERMTIKELSPIALCAFGWSFTTTLPVLSRLVPSSAGLTAYSFLTLLGVYITARFVRRLYDSNDRFKACVGNMKIVLPTVVIALILSAAGLGDYNSPFAVVLAGCVFLIVKGCRIPSWLGRICAFLGPSMFSVYLMHSHGQAWSYLVRIENAILGMGMPICIAYVGTAAVIFLVCVLLDMPRRIIVYIVAHR